jgi:hypothetical protein
VCCGAPGQEELDMIITLSRQFLAGADKVAERVASELGWLVVDDAFIGTLAERSGFDPEDVKGLEERVPSFMERFAHSSALSMPEFLISAPDATSEPEAIKLAHMTRDLVAELGRRDRVVLVGRAAAAVRASATRSTSGSSPPSSTARARRCAATA